MTFTFRPAVRENVGLLIGLAGAGGSRVLARLVGVTAGRLGRRPAPCGGLRTASHAR